MRAIYIRVIITIFGILFISIGHAQKQKVWLDADTGNEMDDLYAIVRLIKDDSVDLIGLSSAHFNNADLNVFEKWNAYHTSGLVTVEESQRLNEQILGALDRLDIPHPLGADRQIGRAWGQQDIRPSPASKAIIKAVKSLSEEEILDILTLGPLTNVASAIMEAPEIVPYIKLYALGAKCHPESKVWNKSEFNIRNDLNAFDYLLDFDGLEMIVMPLEAAFPLQFDREETYDSLNDNIEVEKILADRWREHNPQDKKRVMWDLALVAAYLNPDLSSIETTITPPENVQRSIKVYVKIDEKALEEDFYRVLKK